MERNLCEFFYQLRICKPSDLLRGVGEKESHSVRRFYFVRFKTKKRWVVDLNQVWQCANSAVEGGVCSADNL